MNKMQSNIDVYGYLVSLKKKLDSDGHGDLAAMLSDAIDERFATGAEFLAACDFSLGRLIKNGRAILDSGMIADAENVLSQIRSSYGSQRSPLEE